MNSESKTTEDILREMREYANQLDNDGDTTGADFRDFANQLEEAMKREKVEAVILAATKAVNLTDEKWRRERIGNIAAMRAALDKVLECYKSGAIRTVYNDPESWRHDDELCYLKDDVEAALAAPPRNCDVGAAEEQEERFDEFCSSHFKHCSKCPLFDKFRFCQSAWMQLPYEKEGASK